MFADSLRAGINTSTVALTMGSSDLVGRNIVRRFTRASTESAQLNMAAKINSERISYGSLLDEF